MKIQGNNPNSFGGSIDGGMASRTAETLSSVQAAAARSAAGAGGDEAAEAFETYFSTLLVKELRRSLPEGFFSGSGSDVYAGWGVRAAALRTWGKSAFDPPGQTFLGVEGDLTLTSANLSLGVFRGVDRDDEDREWIGMVGLGWGF